MADRDERPTVTPELELHDFLLRTMKGICGAYEMYLYRKYGYKLTKWQYQADSVKVLLQEQERERREAPRASV